MRTGDVSEDANVCSTRVVQSRATSRSSRRHCPTRVSLRNRRALSPRARGQPPDAQEKKSRSGSRETERGARSRTRLEPRGHESFARREHGVVRRPRLVEVLHEVHRLGRGGVGRRHRGLGRARAPDGSEAIVLFCERSKRPRLTGQPRHRLQAAGFDFGVTGLFSTGTVDRADRRVGEKRLDSIGKLGITFRIQESPKRRSSNGGAPSARFSILLED
jgi:hypothetical protein